MKKQTAFILVIALLLTIPAISISSAAADGIVNQIISHPDYEGNSFGQITDVVENAMDKSLEEEFYISESGNYSLSLCHDGLCYWYQDGIRFAGKYQETSDGLSLKMIGTGKYADTVVAAERDSSGLSVYGKMVDEHFAKGTKDQKIFELDQQIADRKENIWQNYGDVNVEKTLLLNWNGIEITLKEWIIIFDQEMLIFDVKNDNEEDWKVSINTFYVNGINLLPGDMAFFIDSHEEAEKNFAVSESLFEAANIDCVETVSISLSIKNSSSYDVQYVSEAVAVPVKDNTHRAPASYSVQKDYFYDNKLHFCIENYYKNDYSILINYSVENLTEESFILSGKALT